MNNQKTFLEFLQESHSKQYQGGGDEMPDNFDDAMAGLGNDERIALIHDYLTNDAAGIQIEDIFYKLI